MVSRLLQIKMAQGAKPGEGGQLPGGKVYPWVAKTRHSTTGVGLISPPPHHDIYSIEDLAQLIYDLKCSNRKAAINVKLVSEAGVGTIAAGVAKAGAEVILISGFDGGTGAAPRNSIHNAGLPWELGLAEAHQSLIMNGLRSRVRIEADSKLMSGRDVAIAAMLGAEEFGFGTGPLVAMGCVMMRVCNLDTCPMGICTQNPELRKRFKGKPEYIINFMRFMAEDLREYMARLGVHTVDELVGRTDLLKVKDAPAGSRASEMDLTALLKNPLVENSSVHFNAKDVYNFGLEKTPDMRVLMKKFKKSFDMAEPKPMTVELEVGNTDRAFGTIFGSEITRKFGNTLPEDTFHVICNGYGGQSFGAFIPAGLTLELVGDSNDYMGKGLSGGKIIVYPPKGSPFKPEENIIIGNVALYGATSGKALSQERLQAFVASCGAAGGLLFVAFQMVQVVVPVLPGGLGCLVGVVLFGPVMGFVYNYVGICIGSLLAFAVARNCGRPLLSLLFSEKLIAKYSDWTERNDRFARLFALAIFFPVAPDDFLCYLAGTTSMTWRRFTTIILLGKPLSIALYSLGLTVLFQQITGWLG